MFTNSLASSTNTESTLSKLTADEYRQDILEHMIRVDKETRPDPTMIDQQPEISWSWWPVLVNMMVDMHNKLGLEPETLFLAVNIVNRYCARRIVYQKHFRLVGITAMWIASKYEDKKSSVPTLRLLRHMASDHYSEDMFLMMEGHILNTLEWYISHSTVDSFLKVILSETSSSPLLVSLTNYIAEITLYHKVFVGRNPLHIARAVHVLALHLLNVQQPVLSDDAEQWQHWVPTLAETILNPPQAVLEKYRSPERHVITQVVDGWVLRRQRAAQEEAQAQARAQTKQNLRLNILSRQSSSASLPLTPPPSATRTYTGHGKNFNSDFTPPSISGFDHGIYGDSPLTINSLASLNSLGSVTSLSSANSNIPCGIMDAAIAHSPPTTPLNPPKPFFRA